MKFNYLNGVEGISFTNAQEKERRLLANNKFKQFDMIYKPSENEWLGKVTIQAIIENIR